eukprot:5057205-Prorocentrum_lima.AAC.1
MSRQCLQEAMAYQFVQHAMVLVEGLPGLRQLRWSPHDQFNWCVSRQTERIWEPRMVSSQRQLPNQSVGMSSVSAWFSHTV